MEPNNNRPSSQQSGFSLVEIMVGLTIGLLTSLVIVQIMSAFEAQKRVTTGTADAQTNGNIALFNIERELQMAGYPVMPPGITPKSSPFSCPTLIFNGAVDNSSFKRLSPVVITDGGNGSSDTVTIRYGSALLGGIPTKINVMVGNDATVASSFGCRVGDTTLASQNGKACAISRVSAVPDNKTITIADTSVAAPGVDLACLGNWNEVTYTVNNGNLQRAGIDTVAGIVSLQAQYGISAAPNNNQVIDWVDAANGVKGNFAASSLSVTDRNRIKAIRIAVVARNSKKETTNPPPTTACSSTTAAAPSGLCAWDGASFPAPTLDLSASDTDWQNYRYRVFETTIPLRNIIWSRGSL